MDILLSEEFKNTIRYFVNMSDTRRADHILTALVEQSVIDDEFGHLIYPAGNDHEYDPKADILVLDAVEDEIKRQLLNKFDE